MQEKSRPEKIRQYIGESLVRLGARPDAAQRDALLIRRGVYCGHRISRDRYQAVWFVEENEIKFFAPDGRLLESCVASDVAHSDHQRHAA